MKPPERLLSGKPIKILATVKWLECKDLCVPGQADLILEIPVNYGVYKANDNHTRQFKETRKKLPDPSSDWQISARNSEKKFIVKLNAPPACNGVLGNIFFYPEEKGIIDHSANQEMVKTDRGFILKLKKSPYEIKSPGRLKGIIVSETGWFDSDSAKALQIDIAIQHERNIH